MAAEGTEAIVLRIPDCDIHKYDEGVSVPAVYDARTKNGQWAFLCQGCFDHNGPGQLGVGYGQRLVLKSDG